MNRVAAIAGAVIVIVVVIGGGLFLKSRHASDKQNDLKKDSATKQETSMGGLQITDEKVGDGDEAVAGKTVTVNYLGTLQNGTKFDSSYDRNQPFDFALGGGQVIKGWDQGVVGMKVGGKRKLVIPPDLAYGSQSPSAQIPPNSTLVFEIELLAVK